MRAALIISCALALAGCGKTPNEQRRPSSSLSEADALAIAFAARSIRPQIEVHTVSETHSMEPVIYGNVIALSEPVDIGDVHQGDVILWRRTQGFPVNMHQCYANDGRRIGVRGANNLRSDNTDSFFITSDNLVGRYVGHIVFDPKRR